MRTGHPSGLTLSRYVDGGLTARRGERVAAHVADCCRCRELVAFYRRLGEVAGDYEPVEPPNVADAVLRRRRQGERIALLAEDDDSHTFRRTGFGIAASVAIAALAGAYLLFAPLAEAHRSELSFEPEIPEPGELVDLTYRATSSLAAHDSLRLRLRARNAASPNPRRGLIGELRTGTLRRTEDGLFEGQFSLRPEDLYVAAAVENFEGEIVDTNFGRLWDLLIATEDGEPSIAALESKYRVLEPFNWMMASEWAAQTTDRYPENPFGWTLLYVHQSRAGTVPLADSLRELHREKLRSLIASRKNQLSKPDETAWLARYARLQGFETLQDSLLGELSQLDASHPAVVDRRVREVLAESPRGSDSLVDRLEQLWLDDGHSSEFLVRAGILAAARAGNATAARKWIDRGRRTPGLDDELLAGLIDSFDNLVHERIRLRRARIRQLQKAGDESRPLRLTVREHGGEVAATLEALSTSLAKDLALAGDTAAALQIFAESAGRAWVPGVLEPYVDFLVATGDTTLARKHIGVLYADPFAGEAARQKYESVLQPQEDGLPRYRLEYVQRVLDSLIPEGRLKRQTELHLLNGDAFSAGDLAGSPTVLMMWEPELPNADELITRFLTEYEEAGEVGAAHRLVVTHTNVPPSVPGLTHRIINDREYEISQLLKVYGVPVYTVLDSRLTAVARTSHPETAFRIAYALSID